MARGRCCVSGGCSRRTSRLSSTINTTTVRRRGLSAVVSPEGTRVIVAPVVVTWLIWRHFWDWGPSHTPLRDRFTFPFPPHPPHTPPAAPSPPVQIPATRSIYIYISRLYSSITRRVRAGASEDRRCTLPPQPPRHTHKSARVDLFDHLFVVSPFLDNLPCTFEGIIFSQQGLPVQYDTQDRRSL